LKCAGLEGPIENYVDFDHAMIRPAEVDLLIGDASKAKASFGWEPKVKFEELVKIMVENDLNVESTRS
jgi:GDPmannose 4,6-dehydratase